MRSLSYLSDDERRAALMKPASPPGGKSNVELIPASRIEPVPIKWLWPGWLARGRLNVLAGPPGSGKTTLAGEMPRLSRRAACGLTAREQSRAMSLSGQVRMIQKTRLCPGL